MHCLVDSELCCCPSRFASLSTGWLASPRALGILTLLVQRQFTFYKLPLWMDRSDLFTPIYYRWRCHLMILIVKILHSRFCHKIKLYTYILHSLTKAALVFLSPLVEGQRTRCDCSHHSTWSYHNIASSKEDLLVEPRWTPRLCSRGGSSAPYFSVRNLRLLPRINLHSLYLASI